MCLGFVDLIVDFQDLVPINLKGLYTYTAGYDSIVLENHEGVK